MAGPRAKIFNFMQERDAIKLDVVDRVVRGHSKRAHQTQDRHLDYVLNEASYLEMQRLAKHSSKMDLFSYEYWHQLARSIGRMGDEKKLDALRDMASVYCEDVAGKFTPSVYKFATKILSPGLGFAFNSQKIGSLFKNAGNLSNRVIIQGQVEQLKKLASKGTLIMVPTHSSNLDSILVGWALEEIGLPPMTYGAGKNLFNHPLMSFFMHNLGAYKVDRRLRHGVYKDVLKSYSEVLIERGYHSLFFPNGTRCRSNEVESRLKLGLMGTALSAYTNHLQASRRNEKIYICPLTINYHLVLEAESLIKEYLRLDGGARFMVEGDEFSDMSKIRRFVSKSLNTEYTLHLNFSTPIDPFGNLVDDEGESLDPRGRRIDIERYLWKNGEVVSDPQRDAEYTRACGRAVGKAYREGTVALSTNFLSFVLFQHARSLYPGLDLYRLLRVIRGELVSFEVLYRVADRLREKLLSLADDGKILLAQDLREMEIPALIERAAGILKTYHPTPVVKLRAGGLEITHPNLLLFYGNRLKGYGLEGTVNEKLNASLRKG